MEKPYFDKDTIQILLFSDIHESIPIDKIRSTIEDIIKNNAIDVIFIGGDIQCIKHAKDIEEEDSTAEEDTTYWTTFLHELSQAGIPYLWIPGNHDPSSSYKDEDTLSVHNKIFDIAPQLTLVGLGGSCPAYDINGSIVWKGYPKLEKDLDISSLSQSVGDIPENNSVIFFTHCPPTFAPSSHLIKNDVSIMTGSDSLQELYSIVNKTNSVPLYIHGHCHKNLAFNIVKNTCIVSAGSVMNGFFTIINLERRNEEWKVSKYTNLLF